MKPRRLCFVVNPAAGARHGAALRDRIVAWRGDAAIELDWHVTQSKAHARDLARTCDLEGDALLCAVGGDGTAHDVANGLLAREHRHPPTLGIVQAGTGNAIARELGVPDLDAVLHRIASGASRPLDVARLDLDGRVEHAINIIGWDAFARINRRAESLRFLGSRRYVLAAAAELLRPGLRKHGARIAGHHADRDRYVLGAACVTRYTGKGMLIAPKAVLDDGYLDLVLVRQAPRVVLAGVLRGLRTGRHLAASCVDYRRVDELDLSFAAPADIVIDGELAQARNVAIRVQSRALLLTG